MISPNVSRQPSVRTGRLGAERFLARHAALEEMRVNYIDLADSSRIDQLPCRMVNVSVALLETEPDIELARAKSARRITRLALRNPRGGYASEFEVLDRVSSLLA